MANYVKRIARRLRGHERRLQTIEEKRQPDVEPVLVRRMPETAVTDENVTVTEIENPVAVFGESEFGRSEFGTNDDLDGMENTVLSEETVSNTTTIELDEYRARDISQGEADDDADRIAVGTDDTVAPAYENRELNDPVVEDGEAVTLSLDEFAVDGTTVTMNGFLGTNQANGNTIVEAGVVSSEGRLFNHATHSTVEKTNSVAITYEASFEFDTAGGA